MNLSKDVLGTFFLLAIAAILAFCFNRLSPFGISVIGQWDETEGVVSAQAKNQEIDNSLDITDPETVQQIIADKARIILDVRSKDAYDEGHIPGALSFPLMAFDDNFPFLMNTIKKDSPVLLYCASIHCTDSHTFAERLVQMKFLDVKVFAGGFRAWEEVGYDIEKTVP